ncbi:MAG: peptidyl-prolyl cis-trans isomerase [Chthoniobacter sp.]|nr:peptidyl-prolyl cis-trans isomerase [Chthoniobacter sp.]
MLNKLIRRYQQPLLIVFTVVIIITFVAFFDRSGGFLGQGRSERAGTIYGQSVTQVQILREGRKFTLARDLGLQELLRAVIGQANSEAEAIDSFTWNSMVLRHEEDELGINATTDEVFAAIQGLRIFQTGSAFDPKRYEMISKDILGPRGFDGKQIEDLVRDELRLKKLKAVLGTTTVPAASEVRALFDQRNQKTEASVVRLKLDDFLATATAPDEEVQKRFEERKADLKSEEKRKVQVAAFILPTTDKPLEGKARGEALGKLAAAAEEFSVAMTEKDADFTAVAAKAGVKVEETAEFARRDAPPLFSGSAEVVAAAFKLTMKQPTSDVISTDRGYYALRLTGIAEARPLTFDEAKPQLAEQIKRERAKEAMELKATDIRTKLDTELKAGKSMAEAAAAAGVKADAFGAFSQAEPKFEGPDAREVMMTAFNLKEGELSSFVPTMAGGILVRADKRPPIDDSKFAAEKDMLSENLAQFSREAMFAEWLKLRRAEARVMVPKRG